MRETLEKILALEETLNRHPQCPGIEVRIFPTVVIRNGAVLGEILLEGIYYPFYDLEDCLRQLRRFQRLNKWFGPRGRPRKYSEIRRGTVPVTAGNASVEVR